MTTTYDPFIPADGTHQQQYGGHRRAEGRDEGGGWGVEQRGHRAQEVTWQEDQRWEAAPRQRRPEESQRWEGESQQRWEGEPRHRQEERRDGDRGWDAGSQAIGGHQAGSGYQAEVGHSGGGQHWESEQRAAGERQWGQSHAAAAQSRWQAETAAPVPAERARTSMVKPVLTGVLVLLLLVVGWQAYRIEQMNSTTDAMHSTLAAEQDRTSRLEKELTGMFDPEAVSSTVLPSVFRVRAGDFTGTAFSVGSKAADGQANLFTNYHVVAEVYAAGGRKVSLERGTTKIDATIVKVNKGKDLALLHAAQEIKGIGPSTAQVKPGQQVVVVGAPLGLDDTVTTGVISAWRPNDPDGPTIQFDAPINPGNSGGPVVNGSNQVVGLATAKAKDAEGIGLAIPIKTACEAFGGVC